MTFRTFSSEEFVRDWGSPVYIYDLDDIRRAHANLTSYLPEQCTLYYSLKANPNPSVIRVLRDLGCHAEVSSVGESGAALDAGFPGGAMIYTGPGKTASEVDNALRSGVRRFSVESLKELQRLGALASAQGVEAEVLLRVNGDPAGSSGLRMTGNSSQFGIDADQIFADTRSFLAVPGIKLSGLHFYPISGARDEDALVASFVSSIILARKLADAGITLKVLDLGGGFATPYAQPGERSTYPGLKTALNAALDEYIDGWRDGSVSIAFESGRYLVGGCGRLLATVQDVKRSIDRIYVVLDAGIHQLGGMSGLGRLTRPSAMPVTLKRSIDTAPVTIVGPLCTPADILGREAKLGEVAVGDVLEFVNVGAYGLTASLLGFLSRPTPTEIIIDNGAVTAATRLQLTQQHLDVRDQEAP